LFYGKNLNLFLSATKTLCLYLLFGSFLLFSFCSNHPLPDSESSKNNAKPITNTAKPNPKGKTIHVFVALCDNKYQGIVPVGKSIGNGQDPDNNLYWGCEYGIRSYFKKTTSDWIFISGQKNVSEKILERILFKHKTRNVFLLADAYDGKFIKETTIDFLNAASGQNSQQQVYNKDSVYFGGSSNLIAYIGHNGLMDFSLPLQEQSTDTTKRDAIILACYSKKYFATHLKQTGAKPLVWTTGLMAPEAYTLHDALNAWIFNRTDKQVQQAAAKAYARYQKCSLKAAGNLLVSGW
jgi:hypothetical protein